jgi:hypothetical protein
LFRTGDFFEDFDRRRGPDERLVVGIVVFQVFHNGALEFSDGFEGTAADSVSGDLGEESTPPC